MKYFVAGCGLTGAIIAERIANVLQEDVVIFEKRDHIGGNCNSFVDSATGIECHRYGSHIFHISDRTAIAYISKFCHLNNYRHHVMAMHAGRAYCMPINLFTINKFYGQEFSPDQARSYLDREIAGNGIEEPANLEDKVISLIGRPLYEAFIRDYTLKQWGRPPAELPASIIKRLKFRTSYDCGYFDSPFQGLPLDGYGKLFQAILSSPRISVHLNTDFLEIQPTLPCDATVIYTGMPDELFTWRYGALAWRSLCFEWERLPVQDYQGAAVMNFSDLDTDFTRIHEYKHYHPERVNAYTGHQTIICREYPAPYTRGEEAFYPINDNKNNFIYEQYKNEARLNGIILAGRLGAYRYIDMGEAIKGALDIFEDLHSDRGKESTMKY